MRFQGKKPKISNFVRSCGCQVMTCFLLCGGLVFVVALLSDIYHTEDGRLAVTTPQQTQQESTTREWQKLGNISKERFKSTKASRMFDEMKRASQEFDVPLELLIGIANAESSIGTSFRFHYDHNCHNWWGIKKMRSDGSHLRCFLTEKAGARTAAKLLRNHYLDEGYITIEDICHKWIGDQFSGMNCPRWIRNVIYYAYNNDAD